MKRFTTLIIVLFTFIIWTKGGSMIKTDKLIFEAPPAITFHNGDNSLWIKVPVYNVKKNCVYYPISNIAFIEEVED